MRAGWLVGWLVGTKSTVANHQPPTQRQPQSVCQDGPVEELPLEHAVHTIVPAVHTVVPAVPEAHLSKYNTDLRQCKLESRNCRLIALGVHLDICVQTDDRICYRHPTHLETREICWRNPPHYGRFWAGWLAGWLTKCRIVVFYRPGGLRRPVVGWLAG